MRLLIIIPAYNEAKTIKKVIQSIPAKIKGMAKYSVLVVDDGSRDNTRKEAISAGATVVSHLINRGLGGALGTAFEYARRTNYDVMVTLDGDGQHDPKEIEKLIIALTNARANVCIGSRMMDSRGMPWYRVIGNYGLNVITLILFGIWTTDSQSGFRAFSFSAIRKIEVRTDKMEVSSEIFSEISRHKLSYVEVPIKAIYSRYSLGKGQRNSNAFSIIFKLILKKIAS